MANDELTNVSVTGIPKAALTRVQKETAANGAGRSESAAVRYAFMQYHQSLVASETPARQEAAAASTST